MAVYFIRETDPEKCVGCGECIDIWPVEAIEMRDDVAVVDEKWCIGCGVCAPKCDYDALNIWYRKGRAEIPPDFEELHQRIQEQSGSS
jgi:Fe-S-cluster-containing hydrogenase component 2